MFSLQERREVLAYLKAELLDGYADAIKEHQEDFDRARTKLREHYDLKDLAVSWEGLCGMLSCVNRTLYKNHLCGTGPNAGTAGYSPSAHCGPTHSRPWTYLGVQIGYGCMR
jgi:hypothetical protein